MAARTVARHHELHHPLFHQRALRVGIGVHEVAPGAREIAHVVRRFFAGHGPKGLCGRASRIDRNDRLLIGEEDPVALFLRQVAPGFVHLIAERHEDVAQILSPPGGRPGSDGPFADGEGIVGHHGVLGDLVKAPLAVALGTGPFGGVRRERLGVKDPLPRRIVAGPRIENPQEVGQGGDATDRRPRARAAALLLESNRWRKAVDRVHVGHGHLVKQTPGVGRHRFQVAALGLRVERPKRQRGLARARHAGEHHQRVARQLHVDVFQVVLAGSPHPHHGVGWTHCCC